MPRLSCVHERWLELVSSDVNEEAIKRAALNNGQRFLQVAIGDGQIFRRLVMANPNGQNQAVDLDHAKLRRCGKRLVQCGARSFNLTRAAARQLPFPAESFDLLLCCHVFDGLDWRDQHALGEFMRVLAGGGRLVLVNRSGQQPVSLATRLLEFGFCDVSQLIYKKLGTHFELVRGVKL